MKQIDQVRKAYLEGCRTTVDVAKRTGLPRSYCSVYTRDLLRSGFLNRVGVAPEKSDSGRWIYFYEPSPCCQTGFGHIESAIPSQQETVVELFLAGADEQINLNVLRAAVATMKEENAKLRWSVRRLRARRPSKK